MAKTDTLDPLIALRALLTEEREAILAAQFEVLERLSHNKEQLTKSLPPESLDPAALSELREQIERNGLLLDAMREGVGSALESLRTLKEASETLKTYDETGRRTTIQASAKKVIRRA